MSDPDVTGAPSGASKELPPTEGALAIVKVNAAWAAGAGLIPAPLVDFAAITGVNIKMTHELATYYGLAFRAELAASAIGALVAGASAPWLAYGAVGSLVKMIPGVGTTIGWATGPVVAAAVTYAVGRVFVLHFGSGGTFLDFDPKKFRDHFNQQLEAGRKQAEQQAAEKQAGKTG
jgi:uncharacterized protein (DUF697 family)